MKHILLLLSCFLLLQIVFAQNIQIRVRQVSFDATDPDGAGPAVGQITFKFELKSTSGDVMADGMGLSVVYQSTKLMATPSNTTSKRGPINTAQWTQNVDNRSGNTVSVTYGGQTFDRRMIIAFAQSTGTPDATISGTTWTEVAQVTYYYLGSTTPQGGYITPEPGSTLPQNQVSSDGGLTVYPYQSPELNSPVALSATPLPVLFTTFNAECSKAGTTITWSSATERDNSYFEVEKSFDGNTWNSINRVNATGNSNIAKSYVYTDKAGGAAQYRIKQVDVNGAISYTGIVRTPCSSKAFFVNLYPIPVRSKLTLVIGSDRAVKTNAYIVDNNGRVVMNVPLDVNTGTNNFSLNLSHLVQGQYYLRSNEPGMEINQRFTITR